MKKVSDRSIAEIRKPSIGELVEERMKGLIVDGTWQGELPGVREVMKLLGVSSKPVQEAIAELERVGIVGASQRGKRRKILMEEVDMERGVGEILFLRESRWQMSSLSRELYQRLMRLMAGMGIKVVEEVVVRDMKGCVEMSKGVRALANDRHVVVLDLEHAAVRKFLGLDREILVFGKQDMEDPRASFVAIRLGALFDEMLNRLFDLGLDRISIISSVMDQSTHERLSEKVRDAYEEAGKEFVPEEVLPRVTMDNFKGVIERLERDPPQVYICMLQDQWAWMVKKFQQEGSKQEVLTLFDDSLFRFFDRSPNVCNPVYDDFMSAFSDWYSAVRGGHSPAFDRKVACDYVWDKRK